MDEVTIRGTTFYKTASLAKKYGYTTDYLGQLARAKKIKAKLIGRSWYVEEESLANYKENLTGLEAVAEQFVTPTPVKSVVKVTTAPVKLPKEDISAKPEVSKPKERILVYPRNFNLAQNQDIRPPVVSEAVIATPEVLVEATSLPEIKYFTDNSELDLDENLFISSQEDGWRVLAVDERDRQSEIEPLVAPNQAQTTFAQPVELEVNKIQPKRKVTKKGKIRVSNNASSSEESQTGGSVLVAEEGLVVKSKIPARPQVAKRISVSRIAAKSNNEALKNDKVRLPSKNKPTILTNEKKCEFTPRTVNESKQSGKKRTGVLLLTTFFLLLVYLGSFTLGLKITTDLVGNSSALIFSPAEVWQSLASYI